MASETTTLEREFVRFSLGQRIEHAVVLLSVSMLCITGLPQRFVDAPWMHGMISCLGGLDWVRWMHHMFGVMLLFEGVYHVVVALGDLLLARPRPTAMFLRVQDFKDAIHQVAHLLGMRAEEPKFGRYDFRHKIEYWALVWGMVLMGATGLILLFPTVVTTFAPGAVVTAARVAHSYEALLAFLAIVLWHFYNAHLAAGVFPLDTSIFTGKISSERMRKEHPLEYEQWLRSVQAKPAPTGASENE